MEDSGDRPLSLVTGPTRCTENDGGHALPLVAQVRYNHTECQSTEETRVSGQAFNSLPCTTDSYSKADPGCTRTTSSGGHSSFVRGVCQEADGPKQFGSRQLGESSSQVNHGQYQYFNRDINSLTTAEQLGTSSSSMPQTKNLGDSIMRAYDNFSPYYLGQLPLQFQREHYAGDGNTKSKKVEIFNTLIDSDNNTSQAVRHAVRHPGDASVVHHSRVSELQTNSNLDQMDVIEKNSLMSKCCTSQIMSSQQSSVSGVPSSAISPGSSGFPQTDFTKSHCLTVPCDSSPNLGKHSKHIEGDADTSHQTVEGCQRGQNLSTHLQREEERSSDFTQYSSKLVEPPEQYLDQSPQTLLQSGTPMTNENPSNDLSCHTNPSFSKSISRCDEVEKNYRISISGNRNIPKKRVYMDSTATSGNNRVQKMNSVSCKLQKSSLSSLSESTNEFPPLVEYATGLSMSCTTDETDLSLKLKNVRKDACTGNNETSQFSQKTNYIESKEKTLAAEDIDGDSNIGGSKVQSANRLMKGTGFESSQEIALKIGGKPIASDSGESSSNISEEQIREIQQIAAKILARPVSVTVRGEHDKTVSSELEEKNASITGDDRAAKKSFRKKLCRKKPLSQVIDMLNQESEQINRDSEKELEIDPHNIIVKSEDDDWTITELEQKRKPTRKRPSSLIVRLKREKTKNVKKSSKKTTPKDTPRQKTTKIHKLADPDYLVETRSFRIRNKRKRKRKTLKIGLKKKEGENCVCDVCGKSFSAKSTLRLHKLVHNPSRPHACSECNKAFRHKGNLVKHKQSHTGIRPHICMYCDKGFSSRYALKIHTRKHTGERPFDCTVCEKKFYTKSCLIAHMNIHSGQKNIVCEVCGKLFYNQANLYLHMRTHSGERPYICTMCEMSFAQKVNLTNHLRTHTGERPFQCETCGHSYAQLSTLQIHIRTHTGEKPFVCTECGKAYATSGGLRMHKKIHGGIKQFKCSFCEKSFVDKSNLKKHVRIHTGEKPYMCDICGRYFNQSSALRTHWKTHPEIGYDTKKKPYRVIPSEDLQSSLAVTGQQLVDKFVSEQKEISETKNVLQQPI